MISNRISVNNGLYRIAVGKYYRNFTVIDNDFTQIMDVSFWFKCRILETNFRYNIML